MNIDTLLRQLESEPLQFHSLIEDIINSHSKLKVGKIIAINGHYADIKFFEKKTVNEEVQEVPILQNVPLVQISFSFGGTAGVIVPFNVGDNVLIAILDNLHKERFFSNNNTFQDKYTHNLANAIVIGRIDTRQQETELFNGVLLMKNNTRIEITENGVKISKGESDLKTELNDLITKLNSAIQTISQATVTTQLGTQPLLNAGAIASAGEDVAKKIDDFNNILS